MKNFLMMMYGPKIINHIIANARSKDIFIDTIDGHYDHLHCLLGLNTDMSIGKVMQLIKGESSFWINKHKLTRTKFEWADEYFAVGVSESIVDKIRAYIKNQNNHHKKKTFKEECEEFFRVYKFNNQG